jgi:CRISPR-associated protein Csm3
MYAKILITGKITVKTGMHIGGSAAFASIGATDSPVIKDPVTGSPIIPGSSFKGKMRTLLAKKYNEKFADTPNKDCDRIKRVFGTSVEPYKSARLLFADMLLSNREKLEARLDSLTEVKFENVLNRITAEATPRQIERVVRGSEFDMELVYEISDNKEGPASEDDIIEDFELIGDGMKLLRYDYIGGSGSRGYGKIEIADITAKPVVGELDEGLMNKINEALK